MVSIRVCSDIMNITLIVNRQSAKQAATPTRRWVVNINLVLVFKFFSVSFIEIFCSQWRKVYSILTERNTEGFQSNRKKFLSFFKQSNSKHFCVFVFDVCNAVCRYCKSINLITGKCDVLVVL